MMKMAFAAAMVMTMSANAMAESKMPEAAPAELATIAKVASKPDTRVMLYDAGDKLNKFVYALDTDGTVLSKTMYTNYHRNDNEWKPVYTVSATYGEDSNQLTYAAWNEKEGAFTSTPRTVTYDKEESPVLLVLPEICNY